MAKLSSVIPNIGKDLLRKKISQLIRMFMMKRNAFLAAIIAVSLVLAPITFANEDELLDKLEAVNKKLQESLPDQERADLLFEKSQLMFSLFGELFLRTPTSSLIEAIELEPDRKEYRLFLAKIYNLYWENRDFSDDDQVSKDLAELKQRCEKQLKR